MVSIKGDLPEATENLKGLMSAQDKTKLNNIDGNIIKFAEEGDTITDDGIYLIVPSVVKIRVSGNSVTLGGAPENYTYTDNNYWIKFKNNVYQGRVDWGDGSLSQVNGQTANLSHTYTDNVNIHEIIIENVIALGKYFCTDENVISIYVPKNVTDIKDSCFEGCGMSSIELPNTITELSDDTFTDCENLESINIPNSVTSISGAFKNCTSLTTIVIPSSVTELVWSAFAGCTGLTSVTIPASVVDFYGYVFNDCDLITEYQLYWVEDIITYDEDNMPANNDTVFVIPQGTTDDYIDANYPSDKLFERGQ